MNFASNMTRFEKYSTYPIEEDGENVPVTTSIPTSQTWRDGIQNK